MTPRTIGDVVLRYPDPDAELAGVALVGELWKRRPPVPFTRRDKRWELRLPRPPVDRFEYQLQLTFPDGRTALTLDPAAPVTPALWGTSRSSSCLRTSSRAGSRRRCRKEASARSGCRACAAVQGLLWSPSGADPGEPLPLLVVRDGPEYAAYSDLVHFLDVATEKRRIPALRATLLAPVLRNRHYSASARYSDALVEQLRATLAEIAPAAPGARPIGMGASLGALSLLHAHRRHPGAFGGLFLQSGSFFRQRFDRQESDFPAFAGSRDSWARSSARRSGRIRSPSP